LRGVHDDVAGRADQEQLGARAARGALQDDGAIFFGRAAQALG